MGTLPRVAAPKRAEQGRESEAGHSWEDVETIDDLGKSFAKELEEFFVNYHELSGKAYRVLGMHGPDRARTLVKKSRQ
jgi:inorganic pyrophosphatase